MTTLKHRVLAAGILACTVFLSVLTPEAHGAGEFRMRVYGFADGVGFAAHRAAVVEAQHEAMREILRVKVADGDLRPFRSMVRKAEHYVTRVEELHVDTTSGQTRVEVDAYVDMSAFEQDLAALVLPRLPEPPTVSCLIAVERDGAIEVEEESLVEASLVEGLEKLGLEATTHTALSNVFKVSDFHDAILGDVEASANYARETLADVVLIGTAVLERGPVPTEGAPGRTRGTLNLKVFRGYDGDLIDAFARSAAITGIDAQSCEEEVLKDTAAKMLGDITVSTVLSILSEQKQDQVLITLHNPGDRERLATFLQVLQSDTRIDSIEESFFSERLARIRLGYSGNLGYLVDQIRDRTYLGRPLEIQEVVGREMNLVFLSGE